MMTEMMVMMMMIVIMIMLMLLLMRRKCDDYDDDNDNYDDDDGDNFSVNNYSGSSDSREGDDTITKGLQQKLSLIRPPAPSRVPTPAAVTIKASSAHNDDYAIFTSIIHDALQMNTFS